MQKAKELNSQGNYIFVLSDSKNMDNKTYCMNFFKDGSIQFQRQDKKEIIYVSKKTHPELLKSVKSSLNIKF